ncbi:MAG TPA: SDR family oxidoreductase [Solirubrobacterales bacterium]|nr:SDR family oxidoreductase [Solirubrobacterales bacterium]
MTLPSPSDSATALITGASSGIGEAIARELAARGHGVTLVARREERLRALAEELSSRAGVRAEALGFDLQDRSARDLLATRIEELGLEVEILVNNAGFGDSGNLADADRDRLISMVELNCVALLDLQARYLPSMVQRGRGTVINIASTASFQPIPGNATYAAAKAFVLSLSEAVHQELKGSGVTVTAVCPGPVKTEFSEKAGIEQAEEQLPGLFWTSAEAVAKAAIDAAEKGRRAIVPGLLNRAGALTGQHTPRGLALPIVKRVWRQAL